MHTWVHAHTNAYQHVDLLKKDTYTGYRTKGILYKTNTNNNMEINYDRTQVAHLTDY